ncbi:MAG: hypothetical protein HC893_14050 [Chloroflexaceae bacterium]|nr:hypothetical protein [Chloroflexaceae bacterium]
MHNMKPELWKVQEVAARNAQARRVFRQHQLGAGRARLTHAAAATSASVDEMLAVVAYRSRTVAPQHVPAQADVLPGFETELIGGELVA